MKRLRFSIKFRSQLSEKLMDLGNLSIAALALGQFVSGKEFSLPIFMSGIVFMILSYIISFVISF